MTYEELQEVNKDLVTMDVKGKEYAPVNQRILAFRKLFPEGQIVTELVSDVNGKCIFKASVMNGETTLATGYAYENEGNSYINKTSYIENCETSAVGRALGMLGIGIETSIASAEEVNTAILNQPVSKKEQNLLLKIWTDHGGNAESLCKHCHVKAVEDISSAQFAAVMNQLREKDGK